MAGGFMKLSPDLREQLVKEIRFAVNNMRKTDKIIDKLYFFSATYAIFDRIYNLEYDPELVFIHQVVHQTFDSINAKITLASQKDMGIGSSIPANLFESLSGCIDELANKIEKDENTYSLLEKIANIGYSTTGNGSYLYFKGFLIV
jgi:hypothetical protein